MGTVVITTATIFCLTLNRCTVQEKAKARVAIRWPRGTRGRVKAVTTAAKTIAIFSSASRLPPGTKLSLSTGAERLR